MAGDIELTIGCIIIGISLTIMTALVLWARKIIEAVARSEQPTARYILKTRNGEQ